MSTNEMSLLTLRDDAQLLHQTECVIVGGVPGDFPVPDLEHFTGVQLNLATSGRDIARRAMHDQPDDSMQMPTLLQPGESPR